MIIWFFSDNWFNNLKGHGNEADFLGFLQKSVPHESLTLRFELFRIWLGIRRNILVKKRLSDSPSRRIDASSIRRVGESANKFLKDKSLHQWVGESVSRWLPDSASRGVDVR